MDRCCKLHSFSSLNWVYACCSINRSLSGIQWWSTVIETILPTSPWKLWSKESYVKVENMAAVGLEMVYCHCCYRMYQSSRSATRFLWWLKDREWSKPCHLFISISRTLCLITFFNIARSSMEHNADITWWHDDVIKGKYFPRYRPFVRRIHRSSVNSPHKSQWLGGLIFFSICAWSYRWANNGDAGDFRHHHAHFSVAVMVIFDLVKAHISTPSRVRYCIC